MNREKKFFKLVGYKPTKLTKCSFKNLYNHRIDYGIDYCIHEEELETGQPCAICKMAKEKELYPVIPDYLYLKLAMIAATFDSIPMKDYTLDSFKESILEVLTENIKDNEVAKQDIKEMFEYEYANMSNKGFWI